MPLLLVRHAVAVSRRAWPGPDRLRPLDGRGRRQAEGLVAQLKRFDVARILSSPTDRCIQTVEPLARELDLPVEEAPELAEGMGTSAIGLARLGVDGPVLLCSHGDVLPELIDRLDEDGRLGTGRERRFAKGATWVLEAEGGRFTRAHYLPPPA